MKILNKRGSLFILIIIYGAISSAIIMSLFSLFSSSTNDQKTKSIKSSYTVFIANLRSVLDDPLSGEILLKNQYLGGN
ncbi:MAG: hypothetical protein ACXVB1_07280, partial [Pseudobdellovibrionaceae bacterium]